MSVLDIVALQGLDDDAAALRAALSSVELRLRGDPELDEARREVVELDGRLATGRKEQRAADAEIAGLNAKITPEEKRLYDGSVRNPKELTNIQHEVDALKVRRGEFEDALLAVMDRVESLDRDRRRGAKLVEQLEERWERFQAELKHESKRLNDAIVRADTKREAQKSAIPPRDAFLYDDLRRRKGGMAVARINAGNCTGCRLNIPETVRRKAFSSATLAQCPNCERILSFGP
jgi:predicted  nucleic acid-binding Zn-ribbon protein